MKSGDITGVIGVPGVIRGQDRYSSDTPQESGSWPRTVQWNQIEVNDQSATCEDHQ